MVTFKLLPTLRNLLRNPLYTALNLSGLAIGMAATMLIALWVQNEFRFDAYHQRAANLWRVKADMKISPVETWNWGNTPLKITELCAQTPGVVGAVQMRPFGKAVVRRGGDLFEVEKIAYITQGWFSTFDYKFAEGSAAGFGERPNDLILTESLARKIFGDHRALGATLRVDSTEFVVHAVLRDPPATSSFRQNLLLPLEAWLSTGKNRENDAQWGNFNYGTFVELGPGTSPEAVSIQLTNLLTAARQDSNITLKLGSLTDIHFDQSIKDDSFDKGNRHAAAIFALIGLLILLMAAINYVNLSTARAQSRSREAGIRKMVGASRGQLFGQFLGESALLATAAGILALLMVQMALPWFSNLAGRTFTLPWDSPLSWILFGGTLGAVVLLAGVYPAILMTGFKPLEVLRGSGPGSSASGNGARSALRQSLVVAQFAISVTLLICTVVIGRQLSFIQNKDLGYERSHIFSFEIGWRQFHALGTARGKSMLSSLEQHLRQSSAIAAVTRANASPVLIENTHSGSVKFDGLAEDSKPTVSLLNADEHFADLFQIQLTEGRWFEAGSQRDADNVLLNETAARKLGLPQPWLGQRFGIHEREGRVIGVLRDFNFLPLQEAITPLVIYNSSDWRGNYFVKTLPGQSAQALAAAEAAWKQWFPERPFEYTFLDEDFNKMYQTEQRAGMLFILFAGIAIFIACLGLFGLVTFVASQRTKEIGIRKVLGASVAGITGLLAKDFLKLVIIAIVIASPIAYYFMQKWLADYAYHVEIQWWMFAVAGMAAVSIAFLTVCFQSIKAALANPVKSLRSE
jgi:putative ABC transport system permease protein